MELEKNSLSSNFPKLLRFSLFSGFRGKEEILQLWTEVHPYWPLMCRANFLHCPQTENGTDHISPLRKAYTPASVLTAQPLHSPAEGKSTEIHADTSNCCLLISLTKMCFRLNA